MRSKLLENQRDLLTAYRGRFRRHAPQQDIDGAVAAIDEAIRRLAHVPDRPDDYEDEAEADEAPPKPKPAPKRAKVTTKKRRK
jgi:hypothetical protein